jgi:DNA-binding MurR/RpiR family transcriptional regulator
MFQGPLADRIIKSFETMSGQLQLAARYVLDNPRDVALLSMREQARQAGVQPATMTRFAKHLDLAGYDEIREMYGAAVRDGDLGFARKAGVQVASQKSKGDKAQAAEMLMTLAGQINRLASDDRLEQLVAAAGCLAKARKIYCLGLRSSHSIAWHLHYVLSLIGDRSVHLDGPGGVGTDVLARAKTNDVLVAVSVLPYTRQTIELADHAGMQGLTVVAITDSEVAPLAQVAKHTIIVPTGSPSFFHTMSPAFVVAEILGAIVAGRSGEDGLATLRQADKHLSALRTYLQPRPAKKLP